MKKAKSKFYSSSETKSEVQDNVVSYQTAFSNLTSIEVSDMDVLNLIRMGIPKLEFDNIMQMIGFSYEEMSALMHVSERTLRRFDDSTHLNIEQSERMVEIKKLYLFGTEVFDSLETFKQWIETPIMALGYQKPKQFLDTSLGIRMLTNLLGRILQGVYS